MNAPERVHLMGEQKGLPAAEYHAIDALSASGMRLLARSAWHYHHRQPVEPTKAMLRGTLVHCAQLEPDTLAQRYAVVPEGAPRRPTPAQWAAKKSNPDSQLAKDWWNDFATANSGKAIVSADEFATVQEQLQAINRNPELRKIFSSGYAESSVFWCDAATGVYCKARPDWVHTQDDGTVVLVDLKATADESPAGFARAIANLGYHRQAAHYTRGFEAATGLRVARFVFAVVSSAPPVLAVPYELGSFSAAQGAAECAELTALYAHCRRNDFWPAYGEGIQVVDLPAWAMDQPEMELTNA